MVRNFVRKMKQVSWDETSIKEEVLTVKTKKMGHRKGSRTFDVPKGSLRRIPQVYTGVDVYTGDNTDIIHKKLLGQFQNVLSESQKEELEKHITDVDKSFYGLTIADIRALVIE